MSTFEYPAARAGRSWLLRLKARSQAWPIPTELLLLAFLIALAAAIRIATIDNQSLWMDEALTRYETQLPLGAMLHTVAQVETAPPLYFLLVWTFVHLFGASDVVLRSVSALAGLALVPIAYLCGKELVSRRAGMIAAAFVALSPFAVWYSQEARTYMLLAALTAAAFLWFVRALRNPSRRNLTWWAVFSALSLMTHFFAGFVIVPEALWLLWVLRSRSAAAAVGAVALVELLIIPLAFIDSSHGVGWIGGEPLLGRLAGVPLEFSGSTLYRDLNNAQGLLLGAVVILVVGSILVLWGDQMTRRGAGIAAAIAGVGILIPLGMGLLGRDYFLARNLTPVWFPLVMVLAVACVVPRARPVGALLAVFAIAGSALWTLKVQTDSALQRPAWQALAQVIGRARTPRAVLAAGGASTDPLKVYLPRVKWGEAGSDSGFIREIDVVGARRLEPVLPFLSGSYTLADGSATPTSPGAAMPRARPPHGTTLLRQTRIDQWVVARYLLPHGAWLSLNQLRMLAPLFFTRAPQALQAFFQQPGR